ncbi:MAG: filamentous hemagglutinin N-terminal domain-containing protein, partial [Cyanobacteria bacterium P01_D01_bin.36]
MSDYQTISVSLLALAPLIGTLPQAASAQLIEAAADSPQTIITQQDHHTQIEGGVEANNNLFHRFDSFNVETGHSANFVTPSSTQAVIGQVSGGNTSYIDGTLQVSGGDADLYLINPAGILFGPNSQLSLNGGFTATTADQIEFGETWVDVATPQDYSQIEAGPSAYKFTSQAPGSIVNHGDLAVADGNAIRLIGGDVTNTGNISAPAGEITLTAVPGESLVRLGSANALLNLEIEALPDSATSLALPELLTGDSSASATVLHTNDDGTVSLTGEVILTGALDVSSESQAETGGEINVLGSSVEIHGADLYADGGAGGGFIRVGGDYQGQSTLPTATEVTFDGTARANAIASGNGGEVILWSDGVTDFSGEISATGAAGGEGGFVETSGRSQLIVNDEAKVITSTPDGSLGTWLLDPTDLSVVAASGTAGITAGNNTPTDSTLNAAILVSALDGNNVTLQATNSLTVDAAVNASGNGAAGDLVLQAPTLNLNETIDLMAGSSLTGTATTVNVGSNGRVQNAVDAIATGGTINLSATTYADGETFIDKDVTLQGQNNTLFDGQNTTRLFNISNGTVAIDNVIVRNGNSPGTEDGGGGLLVAGTGSLALSNSLIENNSAVNGSSRFGGGIYMTGTGSSSITDSTLQGNQARAFGGGIRTHTGHQLTITNSTITNNFAGSNGAGVDRSTNGSRVLIQDTTISNNIAQNNGGGISTGIGTDDFVIERTLFENNTAANGSGGAISGLFSSLIIRDSSFLNNQTTAIGSNGGAISTSGSLVLSDSHLEGNTAVNDGGAIHLTQNATSTIQDTTLSDNNASNGSGGAIALQDQHQLTIANSTLSNNTAAVTGGGIVNSSTALRGLNIDNSTLSSNNVTGGEGGAVL